MNNNIVEAVEQFTSICVDCLAYCLSETPSLISAEVRHSEGLKLTSGTCRRCGRSSSSLVEATGRLNERMQLFALLGLQFIPVVGPILTATIVARRLFKERERSRTTTEPPRQLGTAENAGLEPSIDVQPPKPSAAAPHSIPNREARNAKQSGSSPEIINAEWLDSKRRLIIRMLNRLDRAHERQETFAMRVQRLRHNGQVPLDVANAIRSITGLRNRAVYEEYELLATDVQRVRTA